MREGKVNPDLAEERAKCDFDKDEFSRILLGNTHHLHKKYIDEMSKHPILWNRPEHYELSREEQMQRKMEVTNYIAKHPTLREYFREFSLTTNMTYYMQG